MACESSQSSIRVTFPLELPPPSALALFHRAVRRSPIRIWWRVLPLAAQFAIAVLIAAAGWSVVAHRVLSGHAERLSHADHVVAGLQRGELAAMQRGAPVAELGSASHVLANARAVSGREARLLRRDIMLLLIGIFATLAVILVVAMRKITRTFHGFVRGAAAVAAGNYDGARVEHFRGGSREMHELADAFEDISRNLEAREQIVRSDMLQLRELEQMKSDFVSTVSHELRTPLTSMRGALGLVIGGTAGPVEARARELLHIAFNNTERLIRLINDMLDIEKIESGHTGQRMERCDLGGVLRLTVAGLESYALENEVRVILERDRPVYVTGDPDRLVQVFTNLLSNAIKFSPRDSEVIVRLETEGKTAQVTVADRGPGIPAEFHDRLFGRFQQAERTSTRKHGGSGLGLAIARAIIELHSGTIRFNTELGAGTTFTVELPYVPTVTPLSVPIHLDRDRHRLLILDQDSGMLTVLQTLCGPIGEVTGVRSVEDGWLESRRGVFDAIVIDPNLKEGNGLELIRRLRGMKNYHDVPVLVFSTREYTPQELVGVTLNSSHSFIKSRHREQDLVLRLRAVLAARRPR